MCHQTVQGFLGFDSPNSLALDQLPYDRFQAILIGDLHINDIRTQAVNGRQCLVGYVGSTELVRESEPDHKFWAELECQDGKVQLLRQHQIRTRPIVRIKVHDESEISDNLQVVQRAYERHCQEPWWNGDTPKPIVFVHYESGIPDLGNRFRSMFNPEEWILRFRPWLDLSKSGQTPVTDDGADNDVTILDLVDVRLKDRPDLTPLVAKLVQPETNANKSIDDFIEARLRAISQESTSADV
jgi:hypothetical protein